MADYLNDKGFSGYYLRGEQPNDIVESNEVSDKHPIFAGQNDSYPENTLIVGPTANDKSALARELVCIGKFPSAEMVFIIQRREATAIQIKT